MGVIPFYPLHFPTCTLYLLLLGQGAYVHVSRERSRGERFPTRTAVSPPPSSAGLGNTVYCHGVRRVHPRLGLPVHRTVGAEDSALVSSSCSIFYSFLGGFLAASGGVFTWPPPYLCIFMLKVVIEITMPYFDCLQVPCLSVCTTLDHFLPALSIERRSPLGIQRMIIASQGSRRISRSEQITPKNRWVFSFSPVN